MKSYQAKEEGSYGVIYALYSIVHPIKLIEYQDELLQIPHWKNRIGVDTFDKIEKVSSPDNNVFNCVHEGDIIVIFCPSTNHHNVSISIEINNNKKSIVVESGQFIVYLNNSFSKIIVDAIDTNDQIHVRSMVLLRDLKTLFNQSKFSFFWPVFGTKNFFISNMKTHIYDLSDNLSHEHFTPNFIFQSINDGPMFKLYFKHLKFEEDVYFADKIYVEISKWKEYGVEKNHGEIVYNIHVYSKNHLNQLYDLLNERDLDQFIFKSDQTLIKSNKSIDLIYPPSVSFQVRKDDYKDFEQWMKKTYPLLTDIHKRLEVLPTAEEKRQLEDEIHQNSKKDQENLIQTLNQLIQCDGILPILIKDGEDLEKYKFSSEIMDIIYSERGLNNKSYLDEVI